MSMAVYKSGCPLSTCNCVSAKHIIVYSQKSMCSDSKIVEMPTIKLLLECHKLHPHFESSAYVYYQQNNDPVWHNNNIPTMQFFNGISRSTRSKSYMLSLTECVWEFRMMHCGILINTPYCVSAWLARFFQA